MLWFLKVIVAAVTISAASWLAGRKPTLAGFLTALPLTTMLALAFSHAEWGSTQHSVAFAKSIFFAVPVSLSFFVPFFLADKFNWGFWWCYALGISLLSFGYFIHRFIVEKLT
jgi:hypothetical protein